MNMQFLYIKIESVVSYRSAARDCFLYRFTFFILICKNSENTEACQIPKASFVQMRIFKATLKPLEETETILQLCKAESVEYFHMNNSWRGGCGWAGYLPMGTSAVKRSHKKHLKA